MRESIVVGRILGIPIKLHITLLIAIPLFVYVFALNPPPFGFGGVVPEGEAYLMGFFATMLLFISILLHELAHSYVALKRGTRIGSITLLLFGGVASMEEVPREPGAELKMAIAGPATSFAIGVTSILIYFILSDFTTSPAVTIFVVIGVLNIVLGAFNLIPAFPMDGGRVLRAWMAERMPYIQATERAAYIGKIIAGMMAIAGLLIPSPWLLLIAVFIYIGASEETKATVADVALKGVRVADIMTASVQKVGASLSVNEIIDMMFYSKHVGFPVVGESDELTGIVTFSDVRKVPPEERDARMVADIMTRDALTISPGAMATEAMRVMARNNIGRLIVMEDGKIVGIVSRKDLVRAIELLREQ